MDFCRLNIQDCNNLKTDFQNGNAIFSLYRHTIE